MVIRKRFASALGCALMVAAMAGYASAAGYTQTNLAGRGRTRCEHGDVAS
jgi:hypothetical protein